MSYFKSVLVSIVLATNMHSVAVNITDIYCHLLGGQDASLWYQETTKKALKDCGHPCPDQVGVKQMNEMGPLCIGNDLYSFSMFNIWYNEKLMDQMGEKERLFGVYHEAAHIANGHHQKQLLVASASFMASILPVIYSIVSAKELSWSTSLWVVLGGFLTGIGVRCLARAHEKSADQEAARILCATEKKDVVNAHIALLERLIDAGRQGDQTWHYSLKDQVTYLQAYQSKEQ